MALLGVLGPTTQAFFRADPDDHISAWFREGRYYEADLLAAIGDLGLGGTYVDVGAHVGNHTLYFALECRAERVIAIEPQADLLRGNVRDNNLVGKVSIIEAVVHPSWRNAHLAEVDPKNSGMARFAKKGDIPCVKLDDVLPDDVTLIKVDTEGSALEVLRTAERTIKSQHPVLAVEAINDSELKATRKFLSGFGYDADGPYAVTPVWIWK